MDSPELASPSSQRPPWFTFALTALFSLGSALLLREVASGVKRYYEDVGIETPSFLTKTALILSPHLWILVLGCAGFGIRLLRKVRRATADRWMLGWFLGSFAVFGGTIYFLAAPLLVITPLRKS
jgi:uncharacterized membrane protein